MMKTIATLLSLLALALPLRAQQYGDPELLEAIEANDLKQVKALVKAGADVNLAFPVYSPNYTFFISREALGTEPMVLNKNKLVYITPIIAACAQKNLDMVKFLMKKKANSDAADSDGKTPLMYALRASGGEPVALYLLKKGANYVVEDYAGNTALHYAVFGGNEEGIRMSLGGGLDANHQNKEGITPFHVAAHHATPAILTFLHENEADPTLMDSAGMNAVFYAAAGGKADNMRLLLTTHQLPSFALSHQNYSPMDIAAMNEHKELSSLLVNESGGYFRYNFEQLSAAVKANDIMKVDALLKEGASPEHYDIPEPLLHYAARNGFVGVAELLLRKTKTDSPKNAKGQTPFQVALEAAQYRMASVLYKYPQEVQPNDIALLVSRLSTEQPPADMESYYQLLSKLLSANGAPVNGTYGPHDNAALHFAVIARNAKVVKMLIESGAQVNKTNAHGWTALHFAAADIGGVGDESAHQQIATSLLNAGADAQALTVKGTDVPFKTADRIYFPAGITALDMLAFQEDAYSQLRTQFVAAGIKSVAAASHWTEAGAFYRTHALPQRALWALKKATAMDKNYPEGWYELGQLHREMEKPADGVKAFNEYIRLKKDNPDAWKYRGVCKFESRDYSGAKDDFTQAIALKPVDWSYFYFRGQAYLKLRQNDKACADFRSGADGGDAKCSNSLSIHCK